MRYTHITEINRKDHSIFKKQTFILHPGEMTDTYESSSNEFGAILALNDGLVLTSSDKENYNEEQLKRFNIRFWGPDDLRRYSNPTKHDVKLVVYYFEII